jgi:hypothetical protein
MVRPLALELATVDPALTPRSPLRLRTPSTLEETNEWDRFQ